MRLVTDWRQLSPKKRFRHAYTLGYAFFLGYWMWLEIDAGKIVFDGKRWITMHPDGKGPKADGSGNKKGRRVQIESTTGEILKGPFKGQKINELSKNNKVARNEVNPAQEQHSKQLAAPAQEYAFFDIITEHQSALPQGPNTPQLAEAKAVVQRVRASLPPSNESSVEATIKWLNSIAPNVNCDGLKYLSPQEALDWGRGAAVMFGLFPLTASNLKSFTNISAQRAKYDQELKAYNAKISQIEASIKSDPARMEQIVSEVRTSFLPELNAMLKGSNAGKLSDLRYNGKVLLEQPGLQEKASQIIGTSSINKLTPEQGRSLSKLMLLAAKDIAVKAEIEKDAFNMGLDAPKYPSDITVFKRKDGSTGYAGAAFDRPTKEIWTGSLFFGDTAQVALEQAYRNGVDNNFHAPVKQGISCATVVCIHELAHSLDNVMRQGSNNFRSDSDQIVKAAYNAYKKHYETTDVKQAPYAARNVHEFFAEMITEALTAPNASQQAKDILAHARVLHMEHLQSHAK